MDPATTSAISVLAKYVGSGLPSIIKAKLAPWTARKESEAIRIAAHGTTAATETALEGLFDELPNLLEDGGVLSHLLADTELTLTSDIQVGDSITQNVILQIEKKSTNSGNTVGSSAKLLEGIEVEDHEPDHDWTSSFFDYVQDVSNEDLQDLLAKILAGEVVRPGSTSLRSLTLLKDIDLEVAELFERLCSMCVIVPGDGKRYLDARVPSLEGRASANSLQAYGLSFDSLSLLCEYGLIIADFDSFYPYNICSKVPNTGDIAVRLPFSFRGRYWVLSPVRGRRYADECRVTGVALTRAGRELSRVVTPAANDAYASAFEKFIDKSNFTMIEVPNSEPQAFVPHTE